MDIEIAASQLEALGNQTRLRIYRTLVRAGAAGLLVGSLQDRMEMAASTLSHHLKRLVKTGLVSQERVGTSLVCRAEYPAMRGLIGYLTDECCADEARAMAVSADAAQPSQNPENERKSDGDPEHASRGSDRRRPGRTCRCRTTD